MKIVISCECGQKRTLEINHKDGVELAQNDTLEFMKKHERHLGLKKFEQEQDNAEDYARRFRCS